MSQKWMGREGEEEGGMENRDKRRIKVHKESQAGSKRRLVEITELLDGDKHPNILILKESGSSESSDDPDA